MLSNPYLSESHTLNFYNPLDLPQFLHVRRNGAANPYARAGRFDSSFEGKQSTNTGVKSSETFFFLLFSHMISSKLALTEVEPANLV